MTADLSDAARKAVNAGLAENTRRAYERDFREFAQWCSAHGREPLPATAGTVTEYMTWLCYERPVVDSRGYVVPGRKGVAPSTARRALAGIFYAHEIAGLTVPRTKELLQLRKGYQRELADERDPRARPRKSAVMTDEHLEALTGPGLRGAQDLIRLRDTVMFYLDRHIASRASEVVLLNVEDVAEVPEGLDIAVRRMKTNHFDQVKVPLDAAPQTVALTVQWIRVLMEHGWKSGPLFPRIDRHGKIGASPTPGSPDGRMTVKGAQQRIRLAREAAGLENERLTFHSGRRGFATAARRAGHDKLAIARHGGWRDSSQALDGYIEEADSWTFNPLRGAGI